MAKYFLIATAMLLAACATANVNRGYTLDGKQDEGLVVVSVTHEGIGSGERVNWMYRRRDGSHEDRLLSSNLRDPLDWESPQGRLAFFPLPPGRYARSHAVRLWF